MEDPQLTAPEKKDDAEKTIKSLTSHVRLSVSASLLATMVVVMTTAKNCSDNVLFATYNKVLNCFVALDTADRETHQMLDESYPYLTKGFYAEFCETYRNSERTYAWAIQSCHFAQTYFSSQSLDSFHQKYFSGILDQAKSRITFIETLRTHRKNFLEDLSLTHICEGQSL